MLGYYHSNVLRSTDNIYNRIVLSEGGRQAALPRPFEAEAGRSDLNNWLKGLGAQRVFSSFLFSLSRDSWVIILPQPSRKGMLGGEEQFYGTS